MSRLPSSISGTLADRSVGRPYTVPMISPSSPRFLCPFPFHVRSPPQEFALGYVGKFATRRRRTCCFACRWTASSAMTPLTPSSTLRSGITPFSVRSVSTPPSSWCNPSPGCKPPTRPQQSGFQSRVGVTLQNGMYRGHRGGASTLPHVVEWPRRGGPTAFGPQKAFTVSKWRRCGRPLGVPVASASASCLGGLVSACASWCAKVSRRGVGVHP